MSVPFFSIILCTRNRPDLVSNSLYSLYNQTFKDFEVIFSDNSDEAMKPQNVEIAKAHVFEGLKYVTPDRVLSMHDHYNFALEKTRGQYVGVLTDKSLLKKDALLALYQILKDSPFDILNYQHDGCLWHPKRFSKWVYSTKKNNNENTLEIYDPEEELKRRFDLSTNRALLGKYYNFGKIFFGVYHRNLIDAVLDKYGKLFHPLCPDYTSTVLALSLSQKAAYYPKNIMLTINNYQGTGAKVNTQAGAIKTFIETCFDDFEAFIPNLPIPNIYTIHNICAYDYAVLNRFGNNEYALNKSNLALRLSEDLKAFPYASEEEKNSLNASLENFCKKNNLQKTGISHFFLKQDRSLLSLAFRFLFQGHKLQKLKKLYNYCFPNRYIRLKELLDS